MAAQIQIVRFGALILYGTPVYSAGYLAPKPTGLILPLFGRRDFTIPGDNVHQITFPPMDDQYERGA
jgi:hypothetical protein